MTAAKFKALNGTAHRITAEERECIKDEIALLRSQLEATPADQRSALFAAIASREYELRGVQRSPCSRAMSGQSRGARYLTK